MNNSPATARHPWRYLSALLAALAILVAGTGATPAQAAGQTLTQFYNDTSIPEVYFTIPTASATALNSNDPLLRTTYTAAQVQFVTSDAQRSPLINIGLKLKGSTSLDKLSGRASFKIKFNWSTNKGQRFLGLKHMTLNAMTQDTSMIHEATSYRLYNLMGVPAPKTGYAKVFVNGKYKALYLNVETYDDVFLSKRFADVTQHLYEGAAFKDFKPGNDDGAADTGAFPAREGWTTTPTKQDLTAAIKTANMTTGASWWSAMNRSFDRKKLIMLFAVDNFTGGWDSYSGAIINNYFARSNSSNKFTLMPWGTDQTFGENRATAELEDDYFFAVDAKTAPFPWIGNKEFKGATSLPRGILFQKCLTYAPCKTEYLNNLKAVLAKWTSAKMSDYMTTTAKRTTAYRTEAQFFEQVRSTTWVRKQITKVQAVLKKNGIK